MSHTFLGMPITRSIPSEVIGGLITGQYKLYGGVIRWAPGTEGAGQIVRHLLPIAQAGADALTGNWLPPITSAINVYQLHKVSGQVASLDALTHQLLQVANSNMVLSGLNLAVSAIGFSYLNQKLNVFEKALGKIIANTEEIKAIFERKERAELRTAIQDMLRAPQFEQDQQFTIIANARFALSKLVNEYEERLKIAHTLEIAMSAVLS